MSKDLSKQIAEVFPAMENREVVTYTPIQRKAPAPTMNPHTAIQRVSREQAEAICKQSGRVESSISAACINLMVDLLEHNESIMRAGSDNPSTKKLIQQLEESLFGPKSEKLPGGSTLKRAKLANSWTSTKSTVLKFFAHGGNPYITDSETGRTVGLVSLAQMTDSMRAGKENEEKSQEEHFKGVTDKAAYLGLEYSYKLLQFAQERVQSLEEGKRRHEQHNVIELPALPN